MRAVWFCISLLAIARALVNSVHPISDAVWTSITTGSQALFVGSNYSNHTAVEIFDLAQRTWSTAALSQPRGAVTAVAIRTTVILAGGAVANRTASASRIADVYNSVTKSWSVHILAGTAWAFCAAVTTNAALFGCYDRFTSGVNLKVDIFDADSNLWTVASLSQARNGILATAVGHFALFAGGYVSAGPVFSSVVDIFDSVTHQWSVATLSVPRELGGVGSAGHFAFFLGGCASSSSCSDVTSRSTVVDIFDARSREWTVGHLHEPGQLVAVAVGRLGAVFYSGLYQRPSNAISVFNATSRSWSRHNMSTARAYLSAAVVGNFALFAGGISFNFGSWTYSAAVDILLLDSGQWRAATLASARRVTCAITGTKAIFAGGSRADIFDATTASWTSITLRTRLYSDPTRPSLAVGLSGVVFFPNDAFQFARGYSVVILVDCPAGLALSTNGSCFQCPLGSSTSDGLTCANCRPGSFSHSAAAVCSLCPPGSFCPATALADPVPCTAGFHCPQTGMSSPLPCGAGTFCPEASAQPSPCPVTFFCPAALLAEPLPCPAGGHCPRVGLVSALPCPAGSYCPPQSMLPFPCERGFYCPSMNASSPTPCPEGSFCGSPGASSPQKCPVGHVCDGDRRVVPDPCSPGFVCPFQQMTAPLPCPRGRFCPVSTMVESAPCPPGSYCPSQQSAFPSSCPIGGFCPLANMTAFLPCSEGSFCPDSGMTVPRPCLPGSFCPGVGNSKQTGCLPGSFCPRANMTLPQPCPAAFYCPVPLMTAALPCPPLSAAPAGSAACTECPYGVAPDGSHCLGNNVTCPPGHGWSARGCQLCRPGYYSSGKAPCLLCPDQKYTNRNGTESCLSCLDPGLFCNPATGMAEPRRGFWSFIDDAGRLRTVPCLRAELCLGALPGQHEITHCHGSRLQSPLNVECEQCAAAHSPWNGVCLPCTSVDGGLVFGIVVLSFSYVFATHKLSQQTPGLTSVFMCFAQTALIIAGSVTARVSWLGLLGMRPQNSVAISDVCPGPITPLQSVALSVSMPFIFIAQLGVLMVVHWLLNRWAFLRSVPIVGHRISGFARSAYSRTLLALLMFSFTSLTSIAVSFLDCVTIGSASVVALLPAIDCRSSGYLALRDVIATVLVFACVLPLVLARFLFRKREQIMRSQALHSWAILLEPYKAERYYWSVVVLARQGVYSACAAMHTFRLRFMAFSISGTSFVLLQHLFDPYADALAGGLETTSLFLHTVLAALLTGFPDPSADTSVEWAVVILVTVPILAFALLIAVVTLRSLKTQRADHVSSVMRSAPDDSWQDSALGVNPGYVLLHERPSVVHGERSAVNPTS